MRGTSERHEALAPLSTSVGPCSDRRQPLSSQSEMVLQLPTLAGATPQDAAHAAGELTSMDPCLLYTSDAADE